MAIDIIVPAAGESVTEADIVAWKKSSGDYVEMDEALVELETDKASLDLTAEVAGILTIIVEEGTVQVGDKIGAIEPADAPATSESKSTSEVASASDASTVDPKSSTASTTQSVSKSADVSYASGHPSPSAKKMMDAHQLTPSDVSGSGKDGRIRKEDVQKAVQNKSVPAVEKPSEAVPKASESKPDASSNVVPSSASTSRDQRRVPMKRIRKTISQRLVKAQQTAALLTTFNEIDLTEVMSIRKKYKVAFKEKYEVGLGFMSFFTKAACHALQQFPVLNARVEENDIIYHDYCDIGIAVSSPKGLVVPVIRNAEAMSFMEIESQILSYAKQARSGSLGIDDMSGGTFTITNGGVFGSMLSTPIVNAPQSAILGMHNIVQRPTVVNGEILARPIMYLAVTYDHRIIDGSDAVQFLVAIKDRLEDPARLLIGL